MRIPSIAALLLLTTVCLAQHPEQHNHRPASGIAREEWNADQQRREIKRLADEQKKIAVHWEKNSRGEIEFICENHTWSDYTIEVSFPVFTNLQTNVPLPAVTEVPPGTHMMFKLTKAIEGRPDRFTYHHKSYKGRPSPKIDTGFAYLLPVASNKETRVYELAYLGEQIAGESKPKDWYSLSLHVDAGDTVYAARHGRVTDVRDNASLQDSNIAYAHGENYVEIEQNDYSFAKYSVFRDSAIFVHPGETVEAGQPLGIAGGDKYAGGPQVRFCVFYQLRQEVTDAEGNGTGKTHNWAYVPLYFWTKEQGRIRLTDKTTYTGESPADVVTKEMSKKDAKKWKETHKAS
jgi:hypothetical protein